MLTEIAAMIMNTVAIAITHTMSIIVLLMTNKSIVIHTTIIS